MSKQRSYICLFLSVIVSAVLLFPSCASQKTVQRKSAYHTAHVKKAMVTIDIDGKRYNTTGQMQTVKDSVTIISIQPIAGVEMFQIRAEQDSLTVIDRMQKRYTASAYKDVNRYVKPSFKYKDFQALAAGEHLRAGEMTATKEYICAGHKVVITITYPTIAYDEQMRLRPERTGGYVYIDASLLLEQLAATHR